MTTRECLWDPAEGGGPIQVQLIFVKDLNDTDESSVFCLIAIASRLSVEEIVATYAKRWSQEVTHKETREYLGMETQRQWSDLAIERTTPLLFACYCLVFLIANQLYHKISPAQFAWSQKQGLTFSDRLSFMRRMIRKTNYPKYGANIQYSKKFTVRLSYCKSSRELVWLPNLSNGQSPDYFGSNIYDFYK